MEPWELKLQMTELPDVGAGKRTWVLATAKCALSQSHFASSRTHFLTMLTSTYHACLSSHSLLLCISALTDV